MSDTTIERTDVTWNCVRGCSRVSPGCGGAAGEGGCYAERQAARFAGPGQAYEGLVRIGKQGPRWTGKVVLVPEKLGEPLRWRKPRRVFVNSMSDLFHEALSNEQIAAVFGVMAACPQHMFQVLTKRAKRMREWFAWIADRASGGMPTEIDVRGYACYVLSRLSPHGLLPIGIDSGLNRTPVEPRWPLPNVHLGVSCEDQATADERIPELLACPAAVRFVSYEPALGPVRFTLRGLPGWDEDWKYDTLAGREWASPRDDIEPGTSPRIDWVIVGGESGPGARPFDLAWARSTIAQCRAAGVRVFDRKGGTIAEWPADLRVRQFPEAPHG